MGSSATDIAAADGGGDGGGPGGPGGPPRWVGSSLPARESARHLTGAATGVADLDLPHLAHMAFVRSPHAHARIVGVDGAKAARQPGVVGVWAAADLPDLPPRRPWERGLREQAVTVPGAAQRSRKPGRRLPHSSGMSWAAWRLGVSFAR